MKFLDVIKSKAFWSIIIALIIIVAQVYIPTFQLDADQLAGLIVIVVAYIVALSINPAGDTWRDLLSSRKFWAAAVGIVTIILSGFQKILVIPTEEIIGFAIVMGGYIAGVAFDPGDPAKRWASLLGSRKFWAAIIGFLVLFLNAYHIVLPLNLTPDQVTGFCVLIGGYIASVALEGKITQASTDTLPEKAILPEQDPDLVKGS